MTYDGAAALVALHDLFEVWDDYTVADLGPHLTCNEAEALAALCRAAGRDGRADALIAGHATDDDEGDMHYEGEGPE